MPNTEFNSVEPVRFIPSDGAAPPLRSCHGRDPGDVFPTHGHDDTPPLVDHAPDAGGTLVLAALAVVPSVWPGGKG